MNLVYDNNVGACLDSLVDKIAPTKIFLLTDTNVAASVLPKLKLLSQAIAQASVIVTPAGDTNKNLESLAAIWSKLTDEGATRHSLLINLGGGMVTDMGGFAASTFKRGIPFINVPTTLLAAVDASVGGKTGINFHNLKNQIGVFNDADAVIISATFFDTLPASEMRSGYAEAIKHALLKSERSFADLIAHDDISEIAPDTMLSLLRESVAVKKSIVDADPTERGIRRALNFGHTAGHAFESLAMERNAPIPHGYAVAYGMVAELVLSHIILGFPSRLLHSYGAYCREVYGAPAVTCNDYPELLRLMGSDKKNSVEGQINFTLLRAPGEVKTDNIVDAAQIETALDIMCDLLQ